MRDDPMKERDELDSQLDAALATYVDAEANPGLTYRIISVTSRALTNRTEPRRSSLRWLPLAVPALAAALLVTILLTQRAPVPAAISHHPDQVSSRTAVSVVPCKVVPCKPAPAHPPEHRAVAVVAARPAPRREVFPTPVPLTAQERAFLGNRRLGDVPAQEISAQTVQSVPHGPVEPIHIAAIHIPPLNPPDNGNN
jgi:hypothetical protein